MTNKEKLKALMQTVSKMNHVMNTFEKSLGVKITDTSFDGALYGSFNGIMDVIMSYLHFDDVTIENEVFNAIIEIDEMDTDDLDEIIEEIWEKYGHK